jgi:hypothetical protein
MNPPQMDKFLPTCHSECERIPFLSDSWHTCEKSKTSLNWYLSQSQRIGVIGFVILIFDFDFFYVDIKRGAPFRVERSYCMKVRSSLPHSAAKQLPKHPSNLPTPPTTPQFVQDQKLRHPGNADTRRVLCTWLTPSKYEKRVLDTSPQTHLPTLSALAPCKPKISPTLTPPNFCTPPHKKNPGKARVTSIES